MAELKITKANFESEVLNASLPVLLDFYADWCGPCRMLAPTIEQLAEEYEGKLSVGKINVDEEPELANRFRVASIPTVVLMKNGQVLSTALGLRPKAEFEAMIRQGL